MLLVFGAPECASQKADDDDNDDNDTSDPSDDTSDYDDDGSNECANNTPPELLSVQAIVNGEARDLPTEVHLEDELKLAFEYQDVDCNLEGGAANIIQEGEGSILSDPDWGFMEIGCSSLEEGEPYIIPCAPSLFANPEWKPLKLVINDSCHAESNTIILDISFEL